MTALAHTRLDTGRLCMLMFEHKPVDLLVQRGRIELERLDLGSELADLTLERSPISLLVCLLLVFCRISVRRDGIWRRPELLA